MKKGIILILYFYTQLTIMRITTARSTSHDQRKSVGREPFDSVRVYNFRPPSAFQNDEDDPGGGGESSVDANWNESCENGGYVEQNELKSRSQSRRTKSRKNKRKSRKRPPHQQSKSDRREFEQEKRRVEYDRDEESREMDHEIDLKDEDYGGKYWEEEEKIKLESEEPQIPVKKKKSRNIPSEVTPVPSTSSPEDFGVTQNEDEQNRSIDDDVETVTLSNKNNEGQRSLLIPNYSPGNSPVTIKSNWASATIWPTSSINPTVSQQKNEFQGFATNGFGQGSYNSWNSYLLPFSGVTGQYGSP